MKLLILISSFGIVTISTLLGGWVLSTIWNWFIAPTFEVTQLPFVPAMGLVLVVNYLTHQINENAVMGDTVERLIKHLVVAIIHPVLVVCLGWVILQFM